MAIHNIDNTTFLQGLFGNQWPEAHVCSFNDDPSDIATDRRSICWSTGYYGPHSLNGGLPEGNQYFDIATFKPEADGSVRRRKALFDKCHVFVLDDVEEKIPAELAALLPIPTYKLRTSENSYQWGFRLNPMLAQRFMDYSEAEICNAQDILIASELVPSGKDPGMRGVTRLVRLPGGRNSKKSRLLDGWIPFKCELVEWNPWMETSLEAIVESIVPGANIGQARAEAVTEGQMVVGGHPVLAVVDVLSDKGNGKYDVVCPNVGAHTDGDTSGTAIWTYPDGRAGIKCHHGSCLEFSGVNLMRWSREQPGYAEARQAFMSARSAEAFSATPAAAVPDFLGPDFLGPAAVAVPDFLGPDFLGPAAVAAPDFLGPVAAGTIGRVRPWTSPLDVVENIVIISEGGGGYFNKQTRGFIKSADTINVSYAHLMDDVLPVSWLRGQEGKQMAQGVGWFPCSDEFIFLGERKLVNTYVGPSVVPVRNDALIADWLKLSEYIYGDQWPLVAGHQAFTLQHPDRKIRWQVLTVGDPRTGKTLSLGPLDKILGSSAKVVDQDAASESWGDVYARKKVIIYEEVANKDKQHFNKLKSKLANSELESLNIKGQSYLEQPNLYSIYMFTNDDDALQFDVDQDKLLVVQAPSEKLPLPFYQEIGRKLDYDPAFLSAVYAWFLDYDVSDFQYSALPVRTEAMYAMCHATRNQAEVALLSALKHTDGPFSAGIAELTEVKTWLRNNGYRMSQDKEIGDTLRAGGWAKVMGSRKLDGKTQAKRFWMPAVAADKMASKDLYDLYVTVRGNPFIV